MDLGEAVAGERYVIRAVEAEDAERRHLASIGIAEGRMFTIRRNSPLFPFRLEIEGANYALSRSYAGRVQVCRADECTDDYVGPVNCMACHRHRRGR